MAFRHLRVLVMMLVMVIIMIVIMVVAVAAPETSRYRSRRDCDQNQCQQCPLHNFFWIFHHLSPVWLVNSAFAQPGNQRGPRIAMAFSFWDKPSDLHPLNLAGKMHFQMGCSPHPAELQMFFWIGFLQICQP
jgi:hypothetical protein